MEKSLLDIYQILQKMIGLHRQLLDAVRAEKESLVQADLTGIQKITEVKQGLIESIQQAESLRLKSTGDLAVQWKKHYKDLTLPNIITLVQDKDPSGAEQLRSSYNVLVLLIQRISSQNQDNSLLIEKSLEHVNEMKKNILGEHNPRANTYTQRGQRASAPLASRLISKEA